MGDFPQRQQTGLETVGYLDVGHDNDCPFLDLQNNQTYFSKVILFSARKHRK
jgi:hypothetical protein